MIVHLLPDEKFIHSFIVNVEKYGNPDNNQFIVRAKDSSIRHPKIKCHPLGSTDLDRLVNKLGNEDQLIIHFLDFQVAKWLYRRELSCKLNWVFWGAEFYKLKDFKDPNFNLYDPITNDIRINHKDRNLLWNNPITIKLKQIYDQKKLTSLDEYFRAILPRVDLIYHFNQYDYEFVKELYTTEAKLVNFAYSNLSSFLEKEQVNINTPIEMDESKTNILVGNSATYSNNHLDIFESIPNDPNVHIYCPLSYGKSHYRDYVISTASRKFGSRFIPLIDFYSYDEYFSILGKMDVAIMGHNRAQGFGNIIIQILQDKKVFLKECNSIFSLLNKMGIKVYNINDLSEELYKPLVSNDKYRDIVKLNFTGEKHSSTYKKLFS